MIPTNVKTGNSESLNSLTSAEIARILVLLVMVGVVVIAPVAKILNNFNFRMVIAWLCHLSKKNLKIVKAKPKSAFSLVHPVVITQINVMSVSQE